MNLDCSMMADKTIIYAGDDKVLGELSRKNILTDLLIKDRAKVLFVGEGDFTFTLAFAAYRQRYAITHAITPSLGALLPAGAWEGITSTRYEPVGPKGKEQYVGETLMQCKPLSEVKLQYSVSENLAKMSLNQSSSLFELPNVPAGTWLYGIDATALPTTLTQDQQVIWFQCPWVARNTSDYSTAALVSDFLLNMAAQIQPGVHVCVGIANHPDYVKEYRLDELLGPNRPVLEQYEFVGADDQLIGKLLEFGYTLLIVRPDKNRDAFHRYIYKSHVTLIFRKKVLTNVQILNKQMEKVCSSNFDDSHSGDVLFVGDWDFTFALAFAAYRQSRYLRAEEASDLPRLWQGITSTRYEPAGPEGEFQYVCMKRVQCKPALLPSDGKQIASGLGSDLSGITKSWQDVLGSMPANIWWYGIDPLALPPALVQSRQVTWFLCPWTSAEDSSLLFVFLRDLHTKIASDTQVCISNSSVESVPCIINFLGRIQNDNPIVSFNTEEHNKPYTCLGAENTFTQGVMKYRNNNERVFTLVFKVNV